MEENRPIVGTLTLVYDHHKAGLPARLIDIRHHALGTVLATTHVHLDHRHCLEVIIIKGRSAYVKKFAERILALNGVKHGKLALTATGKNPD